MDKSATNAHPVIAVQGVTKVYQMGDIEVQALRGISVDIWPGEMVAIMGPSGSGKSTLMNIIGCLDVPTEGTYQLDGVDVSKLKDSQLAEIRCRKIGFVFQSFNLLPRTTARANVELPLIYAGISGRQRRKRAEEMLTLVGLGDRLDHKPNELSGGQQQRVAIARALAMRPKVMLFDEVTSALDPEVIGEVTNVIRKLVSEHNLTMLMVTHQMGFARDISDRICFFFAGKIEEQGPPEALFGNPQRERTQQFLSAVKEAD